jgi:hypothetical protein
VNSAVFDEQPLRFGAADKDAALLAMVHKHLWEQQLVFPEVLLFLWYRTLCKLC